MHAFGRAALRTGSRRSFCSASGCQSASRAGGKSWCRLSEGVTQPGADDVQEKTRCSDYDVVTDGQRRRARALSDAMTEAEPSASMVWGRLMSTLRAAIRFAATLRHDRTVAGRPCGTLATITRMKPASERVEKREVRVEGRDELKYSQTGGAVARRPSVSRLMTRLGSGWEPARR